MDKEDIGILCYLIFCLIMGIVGACILQPWFVYTIVGFCGFFWLVLFLDVNSMMPSEVAAAALAGLTAFLIPMVIGAIILFFNAERRHEFVEVLYKYFLR